jgi:hypothetical protein
MNPSQFTFTIPAPAAPQPRKSALAGKALWLVGIGLLANAAALYSRGQSAPEIVLDQNAFAQAQPATPGQPLGARGIFMMPAQLGPATFGLYLMDVDSGTISIYKTNPDGNRFRLMAARSFKHDRFLEDFNNDSPRPKEVQKLVADQAQRIGLQEKENVPTVDQTTRPDENLPDRPTTAPAAGG